MEVFLAAFPLRGATVAIVGEGEAAEAKARLFHGSPARLLRIEASEAGAPGAYTGVRLAFLALDGEGAVRAAAAARAAGALVNVVDRPDLCDFHTPALIDRGAVMGAVATGGGAPVLAAELRSEIEARWPEGLGGLAEVIADLREDIRAALPDAGARRAWLRRELVDGPAARMALAGDRAGALAEARHQLRTPTRVTVAPVWIDPPADAEQLTLKAVRALARADVVVTAGERAGAVCAFARRDARRVDAAAVSAGDAAGWVAAAASVVCVGPAAAFAHLDLRTAINGEA